MRATPDFADSLIPAMSLDSPSDNAMTALYRVALGPVNTAQYLPIFARFDATGRTTTSWNWAACLFTLNWMVFRQLWSAALVYVAAAEGLALLVFGMGRSFLQWPQGVEWGVLGAFAVLAFAVPGLYGNAILHADIRKRIARALAASRTVPEACAVLDQQASSRKRLHTVVLANLVFAAAAALAYLLLPQSGVTARTWDTAVTVADAASAASAAASMKTTAATATQASAAASAASAASAPASTSTAPEDSTQPPASGVRTASVPAAVPLPAATLPAAAAPSAAPKEPANKPAPPAPPAPAAPKATTPPAAAKAPAKTPASATPPAARAAASRPAPRTTPPRTEPAKATTPTASGDPATATPAAVGTTAGYYINVGLFADEANARKAQARLLNEGLPAFRQELNNTNGRRIRVRVGPYDSRAKADAAAASIRAMALDAVVFKQDR